jgi:hypothetical protein
MEAEISDIEIKINISNIAIKLQEYFRLGKGYPSGTVMVLSRQKSLHSRVS